MDRVCVSGVFFVVVFSGTARLLPLNSINFCFIVLFFVGLGKRKKPSASRSAQMKFNRWH